ncbi:MAG: GreA/GreB family elongation factor [Alphaproteobacteria bacterium]|nr:GreA/GreB family elongation factor [Alphaproteobacteria bacterium]MBL7096664.1 GreA/GreB family elongation factor [Alphaproteobacteria bacterium]
MSRAFVQEQDVFMPAASPELVVSEHPNLVTPRGLRLIEQKLFELSEGLAADPNEEEKARLLRDLRYWTQRRASARLVEHNERDSEVGFGSEVTIRRHDGPPETWEIVGEDEADPSKGRISYVSPIADALLGAREGEIIEVPNRKPRLEIEVLMVR